MKRLKTYLGRTIRLRTTASVSLFFISLIGWQMLLCGMEHPIAQSIQNATVNDALGRAAIWFWVVAAFAVSGIGVCISVSLRWYSWIDRSVLRGIVFCLFSADIIILIAVLVALGDNQIAQLSNDARASQAPWLTLAELLGFALGIVYIIRLLIQAPATLIDRTMNNSYLLSLVDISGRMALLIVWSTLLMTLLLQALEYTALLSFALIATAVYEPLGNAFQRRHEARAIVVDDEYTARF